MQTRKGTRRCAWRTPSSAPSHARRSSAGVAGGGASLGGAEGSRTRLLLGLAPGWGRAPTRGLRGSAPGRLAWPGAGERRVEENLAAALRLGKSVNSPELGCSPQQGAAAYLSFFPRCGADRGADSPLWAQIAPVEDEKEVPLRREQAYREAQRRCLRTWLVLKSFSFPF